MCVCYNDFTRRCLGLNEEIDMSVTLVDKMSFGIKRLYMHTIGRMFYVDMYGIYLFGVRFTPNSIVEKLGFSEQQKADFNMHRINNVWVITRK